MSVERAEEMQRAEESAEAEFARTKLPKENSENFNAVRKNKLEKCH